MSGPTKYSTQHRLGQITGTESRYLGAEKERPMK